MLFSCCITFTATGFAGQHYLMPVSSQDKLGGLQQKGHSAKKKWEMTEVVSTIVQMGWHPDGLLVRLPLSRASVKSRLVFTFLHHKIQKIASNNGGSLRRVLHNSRYCDQDCRILIHSRLKALAVNLSQPSGRLVVCWLNWV